jgi:Peroxisomal membrane protein (Pex16)
MMLNLLGLYHDSILAHQAQRQQVSNQQSHVAKFNRYSRFLLKSWNVWSVSVFLTVAQSCEVLAEMLSVRLGGSSFQSKFVVWVEAVKYAMHANRVYSSNQLWI